MSEISSPNALSGGITDRPGRGALARPSGRAASPERRPMRRSRWRLRILLAINAVVAVIYAFSQLDPATVKSFGPAGEYVSNLLRPSGDPEALSAQGQRLKTEISERGGVAEFMGRSYRFLGLFGPSEQFHIRLNQTNFGDEDLAVLVKKHGDRIWGLDLRNTGVTDQGLRYLDGLSSMEQLTLGNDRPDFSASRTVPLSPITDAGLVHLKGLTQLTSLNLSGLPITDSGLGNLCGLAQLGGLYLSRTKVKGQGLAVLKSLPELTILYLDEGELTDDGAQSLAGASNLQELSVSRVPLSVKGLQALSTLPRLQSLDLTGCGLLDEDVHDLKTSKSGLKILR
jgi:Leucine rich repeat/Leucine Rich repeat